MLYLISLLTLILHPANGETRPLKTQVAEVNGEMMAAGSSNSVEARVTTQVGSNFYNVRVMAWEPLIEPWESCLELDINRTDLKVKLFSEQTLDVNVTESLVDSLATIARSSQQQQQQKQVRNEAWAGDCMDTRSSSGCGSGADEDLFFSLSWGGNETGLDVVYSFEGHAVRVRPGEEQPLPLSHVFDSCSNAAVIVADNGSTTASAAAAVASDSRVARRAAAECGEPAATSVPDNNSDNSITISDVGHNDVGDNQGDDATYEDISDTLAPHAVNMSDRQLPAAKVTGGERRRPSVPPSPSTRPAAAQQQQQQETRAQSQRQRGDGGRPPAVVLEILDSSDEITGARAGAARSPSARCWRSIRPIEVDFVGRRLVTMVASTPSHHAVSCIASEGGAETTAIASGTATPRSGLGEERMTASPSRGWRPGDGAWSGVIDAVRGAKIMKVVAEVESHHGVKVRVPHLLVRG